jgi:hypothetical protein
VHVITVDAAFHAKAGPVLRFVARRHIAAELLRPLPQRRRDRMLQPRFRSGRETKKVRGCDVVLIAQHVAHGGGAVRQGSGLVEHNGIDLGQALDVPAALDDDAVARRIGHERQDGGRRRDPNAGPIVDNHQIQEPVEISRQRRGAGRKRERRHDQAVRQPLGMVLHPGIADRRGLHEMGDLPGSGLRADPNGADCQLTVADDGCGKRRLALAARDRQALARNGLLIDQRAPVNDLAVDRDHLAWVDDDLVADREFRCRDRDHGAVADNPRGFGLKFEEFAHGTPRPSRGQIANPVAKLDEPRNNRTCQRIALGERREDRQRIEESTLSRPSRRQTRRPAVQSDIRSTASAAG